MLRSDRSFLPKRPEGQNNSGALGGDGGVGGGKFSYSMVGKRGGRAGVWFLSVCLSLSLSYGMFTNGLWSEVHSERERERITVQAERESETPSLQ